MENYYYYSEMGCVKIGNDDFDMWLLNGKGEGTYWIHLCSVSDKENKDGYEFVSQISGNKIKIYETEFKKREILELPKGIYSLFTKKGEILLEKQNC